MLEEVVAALGTVYSALRAEVFGTDFSDGSTLSPRSPVSLLLRGQQPIHEFHRLLPRGDRALQLSLAHRIEQPFKERTRLQSAARQIMAGQQRWRIEVRLGPFTKQVLAVIHMVGTAPARQGVSPMQREQLADTGMRQGRLQLTRAHLSGLAEKLVLLHQPLD